MEDPQAYASDAQALHEKLGDKAFAELIQLIRVLATDSVTAQAIARQIAQDIRLGGPPRPDS